MNKQMFIFIISALAFVFMGYAVSSHGTLFTEKVKTNASVVAFGIALSALIYSLLSRFWWGFLIEIVLFIFCPGIGYTIFCLLKHRD